MKTFTEWEGRVVDQKFPLRQYLGGSADCAVFLTDSGEQKAAIKLFFTDPESTQGQLSLWERIARLSHPHLMRLLEMGRSQLDDRDLLYVVMEYAEEALSQVLPDRPLTPSETHDLVLKLLDVLEYLHGNGFVHGRLHPANIMVVDNQLRIGSDRLSRIGELRPNPGKLSVYDAPEIVSTALSPATDVWSLGITVVECLTQDRPIRKRSSDCEVVVPEMLPPPFFDLASHCLVREPSRRYSVAEIRERLQPGVAAAPEPIAPVHERPVRRANKKWGLGYVLPISFALILVAVLAAPRLRQLRPQTASSPSSVSAPSPASVSAPSPASVSAPSPANVPAASSSRVPAQPVPNPRGVETVRGAVIHQVVPEVPQRARDTIQGAVRVVMRLTVDPTGSVVAMKFDSPGPSRYFSQLASQAARQWKFRAPSIDGQNVSSEWILRFKFENATTIVDPVEVKP